MTAIQLSLLPDQDKQILKISIYNYGSYYQSEILAGWYMARGKTKNQAIKRVVEMYKMENK